MGVGPFGAVAPIGYTSGVSFGGAPRFFPGGFGGVGAVRGAVYRREVRRGLRATPDEKKKNAAFTFDQPRSELLGDGKHDPVGHRAR